MTDHGGSEREEIWLPVPTAPVHTTQMTERMARLLLSALQDQPTGRPQGLVWERGTTQRQLLGRKRPAVPVMILQGYPLLKHYLPGETEQLGWNVNLKILEPLERALDWEEEEG